MVSVCGECFGTYSINTTHPCRECGLCTNPAIHYRHCEKGKVRLRIKDYWPDFFFFFSCGKVWLFRIGNINYFNIAAPQPGTSAVRGQEEDEIQEKKREPPKKKGRRRSLRRVANPVMPRCCEEHDQYQTLCRNRKCVCVCVWRGECVINVLWLSVHVFGYTG